VSAAAPHVRPATSGTGLVVRPVDPTTDPRWDAFVHTDPRAVAFHRSSWLRVLAREYEQPCSHLVCEDRHGHVAGVLPLVRTRGVPLHVGGPLGAARLSSLPRTPLAGPLAETAAASTALLAAAVALAHAEGVHLELKPVSPDLDGLVDEVTAVPWRQTYVLDLPDQPGELRFGSGQHHGRIRRMVRKAEREGVQVRPGDRPDLDAWYRLYLEAMRLNGVPARPRRLFTALLAACRDDGLGSFTVTDVADGARRRVIAGAFHLVGTQTSSCAFSAMDRTAATFRPLDALLWDAIHQACDAGLRRYDLGEVPDGDLSLAEFKRKWGTHPVQLRRYYWPPMPAGHTGDAAGSIRGARASVAAWQHVPLRVTAAAGRVAYHFL
jgi:CelD/BcsL family acetyltransferase involved in cellulose biosynthesis